MYPFRPWEKTVATKLRSGPCSAQRLAVRPPPPPALPTGGCQGVDLPRSVHGDKTNKQAANWLSPASPAVAPRPVRQVGLVLVQLRRRHGRQQSGPQLVVGDVGIEQHGAEPAVALNDPVDGVALRLEHVVEAVFDPLAIAVEEFAVQGYRPDPC